MKRSTGKPIYSDFLEALQWHHPLELNDFDKSLIGLQKMLQAKNPKIDLIVELKKIIRYRMKQQEQGEGFATNKKEIIKAIGSFEFDRKYK